MYPLINLLVSFLILCHLPEFISHETYVEKPTILTPKNFYMILSMDDPWIVVFLEDYDAKKESELMKLATSVAGLVKVGFVNMDDPGNDDLIETKRITKQQIKVYEYGEDNKDQAKIADSYDEAVQIAMESYPDTFERIKDETIPEFYSKAMKEQKPRKLPAIFLSGIDKVIPSLRYFAIAMKEMFSFAILVDPSKDLLKNLSITALPQLIVLSHLNLKTGEFQMIRYDQQVFGPYGVAGILRYLIGVQNEVGDKKHRETLNRLINEDTDEKPAHHGKIGVEELTYSSTKRICGLKSNALCVIAFLDDEDDSYINNKKDILDQVRKSETLKDHHIRYSWVNATCHGNIADAFGVDLTQLPYVIAVRRNKNMFANHIGSFSYADLRDFLLAVLSGRKKMVAYDRFPKWQTKDCMIAKMKCFNGVCQDNKRRKKERGPRLAGGRREEL